MAAACRAVGEWAGTRELVEVLLHRHMDDADMIAGIGAAARQSAGALLRIATASFHAYPQS